MRTNQRIFFVQQGKEEYDPNLGEIVPAKKKSKPYPCHISNLGLRKSVELFGDYEEERRVVRFRNLPNEKYDYVEYQGEPYKVQMSLMEGLVLYIERDKVG